VDTTDNVLGVETIASKSRPDEEAERLSSTPSDATPGFELELAVF
jgi:hypothetical protein